MCRRRTCAVPRWPPFQHFSVFKSIQIPSAHIKNSQFLNLLNLPQLHYSPAAVAIKKRKKLTVAEMANGLISFNLLFLFLLLLTPLANSMEIQDETDLQPSLNPLANSKGEKVTEAKPPQSSSTGTKREKGEKSVSFHESAKKSGK
jgi:hypothetical protein